MNSDATIISTLAGAVASLAAFISYLYRVSLKSATDRIARMEEREDDLLKTLASTVQQVAQNQTNMYELVKTIADIVKEQQIERRVLAQSQVFAQVQSASQNQNQNQATGKVTGGAV